MFSYLFMNNNLMTFLSFLFLNPLNWLSNFALLCKLIISSKFTEFLFVIIYSLYSSYVSSWSNEVSRNFFNILPIILVLGMFLFKLDLSLIDTIEREILQPLSMSFFSADALHFTILKSEYHFEINILACFIPYHLSQHKYYFNITLLFHLQD